jgi:hypothetical protein
MSILILKLTLLQIPVLKIPVSRFPFYRYKQITEGGRLRCLQPADPESEILCFTLWIEIRYDFFSDLGSSTFFLSSSSKSLFKKPDRY